MARSQRLIVTIAAASVFAGVFAAVSSGVFAAVSSGVSAQENVFGPKFPNLESRATGES